MRANAIMRQDSKPGTKSCNFAKDARGDRRPSFVVDSPKNRWRILSRREIEHSQNPLVLHAENNTILHEIEIGYVINKCAMNFPPVKNKKYASAISFVLPSFHCVGKNFYTCLTGFCDLNIASVVARLITICVMHIARKQRICILFE